MKKILAFCILVVLAAVGCPVANAAPTVGAECTYNGEKLPDGIRQSIECILANNPHIKNGAGCYVFCDDGTLQYGAASCQNGYYKYDQYRKASDLYAKCLDAQTACDVSGLPWNDTKGKCDCGGNDRVWNGDTFQCEESEEFQACKRATGASWDNRGGFCFCTTTGYKWDSSAKKCVEPAGKVECDSMASGTSGNNALKDKVQWDAAKSKCICIKDSDGNDITNPDDYYITNIYTCEKLSSVLYLERVAANKPAAAAKQQEIEKTITELKEISGNFGQSHWKNADGGFNTARLASDSVAGVVLGTVGGVVTSKIIKKNQVKGGFEDINCVIGGQRVAGYADQFNVGIQ